MFSFITDQSGAASNNKPTRGRLVEWCQLHVSPSEALSLQEWRLGRAIWFAEVEKHHCACVVCIIKNSPTLEHSTGEAVCSNVERYIDSSAQGGDKVHHHCEGGGGGR